MPTTGGRTRDKRRGLSKGVHAGRVRKGQPGYKLRLERIAFKPYTKTWDDVAKDEGICIVTLAGFRKDHAIEIEEMQREKFLSAKADVEHALVERATGWGTGDKAVPPDTKAIEYFFERFEHLSPQTRTVDFDIFAGFYPHQKQILPIFHWDKTWGMSGQDQILGIMAGRGFGKSKAIPRKAAYLARINRGCDGMIMAPTYKMLANPIHIYWQEMLNACRIPWTQHKQDGLYTLWGDTKVWFRSYENVDTSGRGPTLAWLLADEFREGSTEVFNVLMAAVRDPRATLRQSAFFSTPNGYDHMYDVFGDQQSKLLQTGRAVLYGGTTYDNTFLPLGFGDMLTEIYDEQIAKQEIHGLFVNVTQGNIYYNFDRNIHVGDYPYDARLPTWIGQDFNYNPLCSVIGQPHQVDDHIELWIVDEIRIEGANTDQLCQELKRRGYDPEKIPEDKLEIFPDASGSQKSAAAGSRSNFEILKQHGFTNLKHPHANCLVLDRYNSVNGLLRNARGEVRLRFNRKCDWTIKDMEREVYKKGANVRDDSTDESKKRGHLADGLGYMIHYNFRIESAYSTAYRYS